MEYIMHHTHVPIMYSRKKINKTEYSTHQGQFKAGDAETIKTKEYANFLHTCCNTYHARDISDRLPVTSTVHLFNGNITTWCAKKKSETSRSSSNAETRAMYTGVLDKNWIRDFFRSIGYPIGPP